jgi:hypothetical protein
MYCPLLVFVRILISRTMLWWLKAKSAHCDEQSWMSLRMVLIPINVCVFTSETNSRPFCLSEGILLKNIIALVVTQFAPMGSQAF